MPSSSAASPPPEAAANALETAAEVVRRGGVLLYPTETFYGLGADALCADAVERVLRLKGRPPGKPLPLIIADTNRLGEVVAEVPAWTTVLIETCWPGPLTLIFQASPRLSPLLTAGTDSIGIRIPAHPLARALAARAGRPLTATSANRSGQPPVTMASAVILSGPTDFVLDGGPTPGGPASTVVDVRRKPARLIRSGATARDTLHRLLHGQLE